MLGSYLDVDSKNLAKSRSNGFAIVFIDNLRCYSKYLSVSLKIDLKFVLMSLSFKVCATPSLFCMSSYYRLMYVFANFLSN
jgi:hypothetical protein